MIVPPTTAPCRAPLLLDRMRGAMESPQWGRTAEAIALGVARMSGLSGTAAFASELSTGRYAQRFDIDVMGSSAEVFDGRTIWSQDISGGVHPLDAPFVRRRGTTDAYLARRGYFRPDRSTTFRCLGSAGEDGRIVERMSVEPAGGIPAVLSIDAQSHLLDSISERWPTTTLVTRFSDYRNVDGLILPFRIESGTQAEPENGYAVSVRRYVLRHRSDPSDFTRPRESNAVAMLAGAASTTVPIEIEGRQLLVWASINGRSSMPFILDTGGHAILTTQAARSLGLRSHGAGVSGGSGAGTISLQYSQVNSVRIGDAELSRQTFLVIPYPYSFYERGDRQPLAGILGLEVFERFATRIDYGRKRLTLTPLSRYAHAGGGRALPIRFQEDMPLGEGFADGHGGLFGIDTGNAGTVILFGSYLQSSGLLHDYPSGTRAQGRGTGGSNSGWVVTLRRFAVGGKTFDSIPAFMTQMTSGSFSSWTEAGNFGYEILSRFVPTFDYSRETLYLDDSPSATGPPRNRAGFVADKDVPDAFVVLRVKPGSPAASAGIVSGDRIVAIDGKPAKRFSYGELYDMVTGGSVKALRLSVMHGSQRREVVVVLR